MRIYRNRDFGRTMDVLRSKHGSTVILRAVSYTQAGTAKDREKLIGGHMK